MAMTQLLPDLREFLRLLNEFHVEYLMIGGYAVSYHGYPRTTADMDIRIAIDAVNARKMVAVLTSFGFAGAGLSSDLFMQPNQVARMGYPPVRIEVLTSVSGLEFAEAYARRVEDVIDGVPVTVISSEDLKANKRASGRAKDLADLENLP
jgi:hypothetical protein